MSELERGVKSIIDLWEKEQQETEPIEEAKARHRKMAETADLGLELAHQCFSCGNWDSSKNSCGLHVLSINCPDWVSLEKHRKRS